MFVNSYGSAETLNKFCVGRHRACSVVSDIRGSSPWELDGLDGSGTLEHLRTPEKELHVLGSELL